MTLMVTSMMMIFDYDNHDDHDDHDDHDGSGSDDWWHTAATMMTYSFSAPRRHSQLLGVGGRHNLRVPSHKN